ncbi:MAG: hypothetical protein K2L42_04215 [Clostridia bacterium]|nr:hypothetical protein [Clostridia bacterium]
MINILKQLKNERALAEFHSAEGRGRFCVGFCLDYDDEFYLLEAVTPDGRWDGFSCRLIDDVDMVQVDSIYLGKIKKLMPFYNCTHREFPITDKTVLDQMLDYLVKGRKICTVETVNDTMISGFVNEVFEGVIKISIINSDGAADGVSYIRKADIGFISVDSEDEVKLEILSK